MKPKHFDIENDGSLVCNGVVVVSPSPEFPKKDIKALFHAWLERKRAQATANGVLHITEADRHAFDNVEGAT